MKTFICILTLLASQTLFAQIETTEEFPKNWQISLDFGAQQGAQLASVTLGHFYRPQLLLALRAGLSVGEDDDGVDAKMTALLAKIFVGETFFISPIIGYRDLTDNYKEFLTNEGKTYEVRDLTVGVAIGNQWIWDSLSIGIEWIGIHDQVTTFESQGEPSLWEEHELDFTFLNLSLGFLF